MSLQLKAKSTLCAFELDIEESCQFETMDGKVHRIQLIQSDAKVYKSNLANTLEPRFGGRTVCQMHVTLLIDGNHVEMVRYVGNNKSFYEPWKLFGMHLWFDGNQDLFNHLLEAHGACKPNKRARFAVQDATLRVCPVLLQAWCPLPNQGLSIDMCYNGDDCWMGPYFGGHAHSGLDINHPAGTKLVAPICFDEHKLFDTLAGGANNNRWHGIRRWADGSEWILGSHHIIRLLVKEHTAIEAGTIYAESAGVLTGDHEHTHFTFMVKNSEGEEGIRLDPWILFWQMLQDRKNMTV